MQSWLQHAQITWVIFGAVVLAANGCSTKGEKPATAPAVRIAAAADLKFALDELIERFKQRRSRGLDVTVTYGASGNLFAQITNRAPFDIFLSADADYPKKLIEEGVASKDAFFLFATGHLVIWVPKSSTLDVKKQGVEVLKEPAAKKIAIANPEHAPYGRAAVAALKKLKLYDQVESKLVFGENVMQAAQFVESGSADVGLIPLSLAMAAPMRDKGLYQEIPADACPPLEQGGVVLPWAQDKGAANAFRDFLTGAEGKALLAEYGFGAPKH